MSNRFVEYEDKTLIRLLSISCVLSNLSQLPIFIEKGITQLLNTPIWLIVIAYLLIKKMIKFNKYSFFLIGGFLIIFLLCTINTIISNNEYFTSSIFTSLLISILICFIGLFSEYRIGNNGLNTIYISYAVSAAIVSLVIYIENLTNKYDIESKAYAYASKNSVSLIIATSFVILLFCDFEKNKVFNILRYMILIFEGYVIILMKSRATIVGLIICLIYLMLNNKFSPKKRIVIFVATICIIAVLIISPNIRKVFFENILAGSRDTSDLDSVSSGRISILKTFPQLFNEHWIIGMGADYFECFPLSAILQFGLLNGFVILMVSYSPIFVVFKMKVKDYNYEIFVLLCVCYFINSVFEGLAPIGPGAKCYLLWLLCGIYMKRIY